MSFASFEDPEPGFQTKPSYRGHQLGSTFSHPIADSPQGWTKEKTTPFTPEGSDDEMGVPRTPQEVEDNPLDLFTSDITSAKSEPSQPQETNLFAEPEKDEPGLEGYVSTAESVSTSRSTAFRYSNRLDVVNQSGRLRKGTKLKLTPQTKTESLISTSEHTDDGLSVLLNSVNHLVQAFLVLFKTNQTAFLATASWHLTVGYSLAKSGSDALLTHTHLPFGSEQLNPTTLLLANFMGKMNLPWTFLALMGFRMRDLSSQKTLLLAFALTSLIQLRFHIKYLTNRQQWRYIFSRHNMSSAAVALINLGCYIASVRRSGRLL